MAKRLLAVLMAVLMLGAIFAGCNKKEEKPPEFTTNKDGKYDLTQSMSWTDENWDEYEKSLDFGGKTFTFASHQNIRRKPNEESTSQLDTEWKEVLDGLEADLNVKIEFIDYGTWNSELSTVILSGDNPAHVYDQRPQHWLVFAAKNQVFNWASDEAKNNGINVNNPKMFWQIWTHALDINNNTYGVRFASKYYPPDAGWIIIYNKDTLSSNGFTDMNTIVKEGKWDWDKYIEIAKACTKDTDADSLPDIWGVGTGYAAYGEEVLTNPAASIVKFQDGKVTCNLNTPDSIAGLDFIKKIAESKIIMPSANGDANIGYGDGHKAFVDGKIALLSTELRIVAAKAYSDEFGMRRTNVNWGILPMPKKPGTDKYFNIIGNHDYEFMLMTNKERDFSLVVYGAFARRQNDEDWKKSLAESYLQDPSNTADLETLSEYVIPNIRYNFQWVTSPTAETYRSVVVYPLFDSGNTPAQVAEEVEGQINAIIGEIDFND